MADLGLKSAARARAFDRRQQAFDSGVGSAGYLSEVLAGYRGVPIAGYMAMRTEIDPQPAMEEAAAYGPIGVPVIISKGQRLKFRTWEPGSVMVPGTYGASIPEAGDWIEPEIVIVPLVAFDRSGGRMGYGGGFYDRTLSYLRSQRATLAIGFAFAAQEDADLPLGPHDQQLDLIVTETGVITPA